MAFKSTYNGEQVEALLDVVFDSTLQEKTITITEKTEITPDEGYLALKKVTVDVSTEGGVVDKDVFVYYCSGTSDTLDINLTQGYVEEQYGQDFLAGNSIITFSNDTNTITIQESCNYQNRRYLYFYREDVNFYNLSDGNQLTDEDIDKQPWHGYYIPFEQGVASDETYVVEISRGGQLIGTYYIRFIFA